MVRRARPGRELHRHGGERAVRPPDAGAAGAMLCRPDISNIAPSQFVLRPQESTSTAGAGGAAAPAAVHEDPGGGRPDHRPGRAAPRSPGVAALRRPRPLFWRLFRSVPPHDGLCLAPAGARRLRAAGRMSTASTRALKLAGTSYVAVPSMHGNRLCRVAVVQDHCTTAASLHGDAGRRVPAATISHFGPERPNLQARRPWTMPTRPFIRRARATPTPGGITSSAPSAATEGGQKID